MEQTPEDHIQWAIEWSNGRLSREDADTLIRRYWYYEGLHATPPLGIFYEPYTEWLNKKHDTIFA